MCRFGQVKTKKERLPAPRIYLVIIVCPDSGYDVYKHTPMQVTNILICVREKNLHCGY